MAELLPGRLAGLAIAMAVLLAQPTWAREGETPLSGIGFPDAFAGSGGGALFEAGGGDGWVWLRATSDGSGRYSATQNHPLFEAIDLRGRFLKLRLKLEAPGGLAGMEFRLGSGEDTGDYFAFTVPRFADPEFNGLQPGEWGVQSFGFGSAKRVGQPERGAIRWISWGVRDDGHAPLRTYWGGISAVDEPERGVLSITFDDGYDEHRALAAPMMKRFGFHGTAYVMPDQLGEPGYMTEADLRALRDEYGWDVAAHHALPFTQFETERLARLVLGIQHFLRERGFQRGADHLAYPLGKQDPQRVLPIVRRHFRSARLADGGLETLPPGDPHRLRAVNVLSTTSPEAIRDAAIAARDHHQWAILMFHFLVDEPHRPTDYRSADFEQALRLIRETGVAVLPVSEVWLGNESRLR